MIFEHITIDLSEYSESTQNQAHSNTLILLDDTTANGNDKIIAQAISLDIRGDFGFFLNEDLHPASQEFDYEWTGNLFNIVVRKSEHIVLISELIDEEDNLHIVNLDDWLEALGDWKQFYLKELGFLEFNSLALSHMFGILILAYDQMFHGHCSTEMFTEAIKKGADRYGVSTSVLYRDCRKVCGVYDIADFYNWAIDLLEIRFVQNNTLNEFILSNIDKKRNNIRPVIKKFFNIDL